MKDDQTWSQTMFDPVLYLISIRLFHLAKQLRNTQPGQARTKKT